MKRHLRLISVLCIVIYLCWIIPHPLLRMQSVQDQLVREWEKDLQVPAGKEGHKVGNDCHNCNIVERLSSSEAASFSSKRRGFENATEIDKVFKTRKRRIQKACSRRYGSSNFVLTDLDSMRLLNEPYTFFVVPDYNLVVCAIPEVIPTIGEAHLIRMSNDQPGKPEASPHQVPPINSQYLQPEVFKGATKVMTVSHPFKRLVSAYRDKYCDGRKMASQPLNPTRENDYRIFIYPAVKYLNLTHRVKNQELYLTFPEYIRWVIHDVVRKPYLVNPYWTPVHRICQPCRIDYNFTIKAEFSEWETMRLFQRLNVSGLSPELLLNETNAQETLAELMKKYFRELDPGIYKDLTTLYAFDCQLFGYTMPQQFPDFDL